MCGIMFITEFEQKPYRIWLIYEGLNAHRNKFFVLQVEGLQNEQN
jgi:hypothetical protein